MAKTKRNRSADDSNDDPEEMAKELPKNKKAKSGSSSSIAMNDKDEPYWEVYPSRTLYRLMVETNSVWTVIFFE